MISVKKFYHTGKKLLPIGKKVLPIVSGKSFL
jgi:hypothetical protein